MQQLARLYRTLVGRPLLGDVHRRSGGCTRVAAYRSPTGATSGAVAVARAPRRSLLRLPDGAAVDVDVVTRRCGRRRRGRRRR